MWDFGLRRSDADEPVCDTRTSAQASGIGRPRSVHVPSCRNAPEPPALRQPTRMFSPPPNAVACGPSSGRTPSSSSPIRRMWRMIASASAAASSTFGVVVSFVQVQVLALSPWDRGGSDHEIASIVAFREILIDDIRSGDHDPQRPAAAWPVTRLFLVPFLPRSVGFLPVFFPPRNLALPKQASAFSWPLPVHPTEIVARLGEGLPRSSPGHPPADQRLEPVVDGASWDRTCWGVGPHWQPLRIRKMIPLTIFRQFPATLRFGRLLGPEVQGEDVAR